MAFLRILDFLRSGWTQSFSRGSPSKGTTRMLLFSFSLFVHILPLKFKPAYFAMAKFLWKSTSKHSLTIRYRLSGFAHSLYGWQLKHNGQSLLTLCPTCMEYVFLNLKQKYHLLNIFCSSPSQPGRSYAIFSSFRLTCCQVSCPGAEIPFGEGTRFVWSSTVQLSESFLLKTSCSYSWRGPLNFCQGGPWPWHCTRPPSILHRLWVCLQRWFGFGGDVCRVWLRRVAAGTWWRWAKVWQHIRI